MSGPPPLLSSEARSVVQLRPQHALRLLGTLAAVGLGLAEELGQLLVAVSFCVVDVLLQTEGVAEARLREPDQVVVLVLRPGDVAGLGAAGHLMFPSSSCRDPSRAHSAQGRDRSTRRVSRRVTPHALARPGRAATRPGGASTKTSAVTGMDRTRTPVAW